MTWIASALSEGDREVATLHPAGRTEELDGGRARVRLLAHDPAVYARYYGEVANPALWFTQHQLWNLPYEPRFGDSFAAAWGGGYVPVNEAFGRAVAEDVEARPGTPVVLHDYHLYLAPRIVRDRAPTARVGFFVHIPWPPPDALRVLPRAIARQILTSLLACDLVSFHTARWRDNFAACCVEHLGATIVDDGWLELGPHRVLLSARPISVSPEELRAVASSEQVAQEARSLVDGTSRLIVRVDRIDPSKNIVRGFEALELLLERWPEHRGQVRMLALLNPSREDVPAYVEYRAAVEAAAARVNARFASETWTPVYLDVADNFARSLAAYKAYDVLLVNPVFDGLNLVAKEGPLLNERAGAVVLSDNAGAHEELAAHVISINPFDVAEQADALHEALALDDGERRRRAGALRCAIEAQPIEAWSDGLLEDLAHAVEADGRTIDPE